LVHTIKRRHSSAQMLASGTRPRKDGVRRTITHTSPSTRSEAARRPAQILHAPHLRRCRSWPTAVGHIRGRL